MLLYDDDEFAAAGKRKESGVPTGSLRRAAKRRFCAGSIGALNEQNDLVPLIPDGQLRTEQTSLHYRSCLSCDSVEMAGSNDIKRQVFQEDNVACANRRTESIAEMEAKKRPHDPQNRK